MSMEFPNLEKRPVNEEKKENVAEKIPSQEEVLGVFKEFIGEAVFSDRRKQSDEKGLYLWEINVPTEDGGHTEYMYMRKGKHAVGGSSSETVIHVLFFDADDENIPISGYDVAKLVDGEWKL